MNRPTTIVAALGVLMIAGIASAQTVPGTRPLSPFTRPTLSPYLNLLRGGNPAANYYQGVRPEQNQRIYNQQFRNAILELDEREPAVDPEASGGGEGSPKLPATGHPAYFNSLGNTFNSATAATKAAPQKQVPRTKRGK